MLLACLGGTDGWDGEKTPLVRLGVGDDWDGEEKGSMLSMCLDGEVDWYGEATLLVWLMVGDSVPASLVGGHGLLLFSELDAK